MLRSFICAIILGLGIVPSLSVPMTSPERVLKPKFQDATGLGHVEATAGDHGSPTRASRVEMRLPDDGGKHKTEEEVSGAVTDHEAGRSPTSTEQTDVAATSVAALPDPQSLNSWSHRISIAKEPIPAFIILYSFFLVPLLKRAGLY